MILKLILLSIPRLTFKWFYKILYPYFLVIKCTNITKKVVINMLIIIEVVKTKFVYKIRKYKNIGSVGSTYKRVYDTWLDIFSTELFS